MLIIFYISYIPFGLSVFAADLLAIITFSVIVSELAKNGQGRFESFLGSFTFSIYLLHQYVFHMLKHHTTIIHKRTTVAFLLDIILSTLVAIFIEEKIIEKRRHRWLSNIKNQEGVLAGIEIKPAYAYIALALVACSIFYYMFAFLFLAR